MTTDHFGYLNDVERLTTDTDRLSLVDACRSLGLDPIEDRYLDAYKARQIKLHRPSRLYPLAKALAWTYDGIPLGGILVVIGAVTDSKIIVDVGIAIGIVGLLSVIISDLKIKGPARWYELYANEIVAPKPIMDAARILRSAVSVSFKVGTLHQDTITLDPYLIAVRGRERVCLGIWNGDEVVACA